MDSDLVEPSTPVASLIVNLWRNEDSGYHTSFTPGSVDCLEKSKIITANHDNITPDINFRVGRKCRTRIALSCAQDENSADSPISRRGVKRTYQDVADEINYISVPTPTTMIAGGIQKLKVTDISTPSHTSFTTSSAKSEYYDSVCSDQYQFEAHTLSFPSTPVKRICRSSCNLSPMKKSAKKLNFATHSLLCASKGLQVNRHRPHSKVVRCMQFRPEQKIDVMKMLHQEKVRPPLAKIFNYLSHEDIYNFSLVSPLWYEIWDEVSNGKQKLEHYNYLKNVKENAENNNKGLTPKIYEANQIKVLKEVHNVLNTQMVRETPRSPPGTPRTNKFKKFTKCASLDSHLQQCVRCEQPGKVTKETSGEEWVQCTSVTCAYQFCRSCNCIRHPGKRCFRYDLDGPSPSKRRRSSCAVGSMKSKRNLRRLL